MAYKHAALVFAAVAGLCIPWPAPAAEGEAHAAPLCNRIPKEWTPFTFKGMEFYRVPLPSGSQTASSLGTRRCSEIPKEWTPFTFEGRRFYRVPLQPGLQTTVR
jgi:hypothetical protein